MLKACMLQIEGKSGWAGRLCQLCQGLFASALIPSQQFRGHELFLTWELSSFSIELSLLWGQGSDRTVPRRRCAGFKEEEDTHGHKAAGTAPGAMGNAPWMQKSQTTAHNGLSKAANSAPRTFVLPPVLCSSPIGSSLTLANTLTLFNCPIFSGHPR